LSLAQANVKVAEANATKAAQDVERYKTLVAKDEISKQQYDQARTKLDSTAAQLRQAEDKSALVKEGPRTQEIADTLPAPLGRFILRNRAVRRAIDAMTTRGRTVKNTPRRARHGPGDCNARASHVGLLQALQPKGFFG